MSSRWPVRCTGSSSSRAGTSEYGDAGVMSGHSPHPIRRGAKTGSPRLLRVALPALATVAIAAPLGWLWQASRVPAVYSVVEMGYLDYGGGAVPDPGGDGHGGHIEGHGPG